MVRLIREQIYIDSVIILLEKLNKLDNIFIGVDFISKPLTFAGKNFHGMRKTSTTLTFKDLIVQNPTLVVIAVLLMFLIALSKRYSIEIGPIKLVPTETIKNTND